MGGVGGRGRVEVIESKGCSRLLADISSSSSSSSLFSSFRLRSFQSFGPMSPASSSSSSCIVSQPLIPSTDRPFSGLVICVTGLSKEARKQVMEATERLGGQYSPHLHPECSHLVVQSFQGRKFEHALKHGSRNGLFVVTHRWFVDSVRRNVRLRESRYSVMGLGETVIPEDDLNRHIQYAGIGNSCIPVGMFEHAQQADVTEEPCQCHSEKESRRIMASTLSGHSLYVDLDISAELQSKVVEAAAGDGATFIDQWFVGCHVSHVVCEGPSVRKYLGHANNLVTPVWVLKTAKENRMQRLINMSSDLARQVGTMLDSVQNGIYLEENKGDSGPRNAPSYRSKVHHEERQKIVNLAKNWVRKRRGRMRKCQNPIRPITPSSLLDSICWSVSEPTSTAAVYTDSLNGEDASEHHTSVFFDEKGEGKESETSFVNFSRPLIESEKTELIFKNHFLNILFPVDRFSEMGPCSRTFFSDTGFTCLQVLDHVYAFYQENMPANEIEVAIHTDSRNADRLRSVYSNEETAERGYVEFKRIDFLGSRKSFEMLKRVSGDNNSNVYELLIRA